MEEKNANKEHTVAITKKQWKTLYREQIRLGMCYCYLCGKPIEKDKDFNLDHCVPLSRGGANDPSNWRATHKTCNATKGALTLEEYKEWMRLETIRNGGVSR